MIWKILVWQKKKLNQISVTRQIILKDYFQYQFYAFYFCDLGQQLCILFLKTGFNACTKLQQ